MTGTIAGPWIWPERWVIYRDVPTADGSERVFLRMSGGWGAAEDAIHYLSLESARDAYFRLPPGFRNPPADARGYVCIGRADLTSALAGGLTFSDGTQNFSDGTQNLELERRTNERDAACARAAELRDELAAVRLKRDEDLAALEQERTSLRADLAARTTQRDHLQEVYARQGKLLDDMERAVGVAQRAHAQAERLTPWIIGLAVASLAASLILWARVTLPTSSLEPPNERLPNIEAGAETPRFGPTQGSCELDRGHSSGGVTIVEGDDPPFAYMENAGVDVHRAWKCSAHGSTTNYWCVGCGIAWGANTERTLARQRMHPPEGSRWSVSMSDPWTTSAVR